MSQIMTSEERKAEYRDLLDRAEILQENAETGLEITQALDDIIQKANELFKDANIKERIKHTDEVLLDAKVVATASDVLLNVTEAIDCSLDTYEPLELANKIRSKLLNSDDSETEFKWAELNQIAKNIMKPAPIFQFFYGEIGDPNVEPKPVKERKRKASNKQEQAAKKSPEKITQANKEEDSVDDTVKFLQWSLNKEFEENGGKPIHYFNFIIDPESYCTTIENMFHLSFLVRDGRVKIDIDDDGSLEISPVASHEVKKVKKGDVAYKQSIISIDMNEWTNIIETFEINDCFLRRWKHRWDQRKT